MRIAVVWLAAGCYRVIPGPGSAADAPATPAPATCATFALADDFTDPTACSWGIAYGSNVMSGGGMLSLDPGRFDFAAAGCSSDATFAIGDGGMFAHFIAPLTGQDAYTGLQAHGAPGYAFGVDTGRLVLSNIDVDSFYGKAPYDPTSMQWLRLRYDTKAGEVAADYSADGTTWQNLATLAAAPPAAGEVTLDASINTDLTYGGPATLGHFRVCL